MGYGWGGYANGQIPYDALVHCRGAWLEPTAAYWAEAMGVVFDHERGKPLMFLDYSEGFRPFGEWSDYDNGVGNTQCYYYVRKQRNPGAPAAAYPGGSIHGWALAVDVDLTHLNGDDIDWLHTRGRAFGWNWDTTGRPNDEPWHLDFNLSPTEPFDPAAYAEAPALIEARKYIQEDPGMRIIHVPGGTIAAVGEFSGTIYTSMEGGQGFSVEANRLGYGEGENNTWTVVDTEDQLQTLVSEANARGKKFAQELAAEIVAAQKSGK